MHPGKMDRRITLQRATVTSDALNNPIKTWANLATVMAEKEDIRDSERFRGGEVSADLTTRFRIRYSGALASLNPSDRLVYNSRVHEIFAVKEIGRREGWEVTAGARADIALVSGEPVVPFDGFTNLDFSQANNSGYLPVIGA